MKKFLSTLLAAIMLLTILAVPVYAEGAIEFELVAGSYVHGQDETLNVELRVKNNTGISAATFYIALPESLTPAGPEDWSGCAEIGKDFLGAMVVSGNSSLLKGERTLSVGFMSLMNFTVDGTIFNIKFKVNPEAKITDDFDLKLEINEVTTPEATHKGTDSDKVTVTEPSVTPKITCIHPDTVEVEGKDPTCTEPGYSAGQKCVFCGEPIGDTEIIPALGHDYKYDHTINEPTCTSVGKDLYKCSRCGAEEEREVPMKDHVKSSDYKHDGESHWFYCVNCDTVIGEKEAHDPDTEWHCEDTSVDGHYHICSVCKAAVGVEEHVDEDADGECDICGAALHEHIADTSKWLYDDEGHYHACTIPGCKAKLDKTAHDNEEKVTKEATCTEKGVKTISCKVCDYEKTEDTDMIPHTPDTDWHTEEGSEEHWHICAVCGTKLEETAAAHTYGEYTSTEKDHTHVCTACGFSETEAHKGTATCSKKAVCEVCNTEYGELDKTNHADGIDETAWESDGTNHWHVCKYCGEKTGTEAHKASEDYKHDANGHWHYCTVCGEPTEEAKAHTPSSTWTVDTTGHWHVCTECGEKLDFDAHTRAQFTAEKAATTTADGNLAYWYCPDCGKYFFDNSGKIGAGPVDDPSAFVVVHKSGCDGHHQIVAVPVDSAYHMMICIKQCGLAYQMPHNFNFRGICADCGYQLAIASPSADSNVPSEVVGVVTPVEDTDQPADDEVVNVGDSEPEAAPEPVETNPKTGIAMSVIPAIIAAAVVAIRKTNYR